MIDLVVIDAELAVRTRGFADLHIAAAVEGGAVSDKAAALSARLCMGRNRFKHSHLHIDDVEKSRNAPRNLKPAHLEHHYEDIVAKFHVPADTTWVCMPKDQACVASSLTLLADKRSVDVLLLGRSKDKAGEASKENASSILYRALRECHASVMIVRHMMPLVNPHQTLKWFFATDGSHAAASGFCTLINSVIRPGDIVDVGLVSGDKGDQDVVSVLKQHEDFLRDRQVQGVVKVRVVDASTTVPNGIIAACEDSEADILVVGIADYCTKKLGSVSDYLMRHCPVTTLVIKDRADAAGSNRGSSRLSGAASELLASELCRSASLRASRRATADDDCGVPGGPEASAKSLGEPPSKRPSSLDLLRSSSSFVVRPGSYSGQIMGVDLACLKGVRRATELETISSNTALGQLEEESPFAAA